MSIDLIIVDDHRIVRKGMRSLLEEEADINVVGEAGDGNELLELLQASRADVVLMDINLKNMSGIRATERIQQEHPGIGVLGLTMHEDGSMIEDMMDAGALGYVFKDSEEDELPDGIRSVAKGERFFSNAASQKLIEHLRRKGTDERTSFDVPPSLTERELRILSMIAEEHTNSEIAEELMISPKTVDGHRRRLLQKFGVRNSAGLIRTAIEKGIISSRP